MNARPGYIDFDGINAAALAAYPWLLHQWFPAGRISGHEFTIGDLRGSPGRSVSINVNTGAWAEFNGLAKKGGDPIGLAAAAFHNGDRLAAARDLGERLGIGTDAPAHTTLPPNSSTKPNWHPMVPPPADAPPPPKSAWTGYDAVYDYRDAAERLLFYVRRIDERDGQRKQFHPLTYGSLDGVTGWHSKQPVAPRPLWGLDQLAARPNEPVLICEGEKAAIAASKMFRYHVVMTWPGGSSAVAMADWAPLIGRNVTIWPDADPSGHKAAAEIVYRLPGTKIIDVSDLPDGHDAADINLAPEDAEDWLRRRLPATFRADTNDGPTAGAALRALLSIEAWAERDIPEPDRLLGDLLTTTTRVFLVGRTGLGKTLLGLAIAAGVASGAGFLHWTSCRPARVLYLDGEMPAELIKPRARDALRRLGSVTIPAGNLLIFGRDIEQDARRVCPKLPPFAPLNTEAGRDFLVGLLDAIGGIDLLICDNVMSLVAGDQKDELAWSDTLPLVSALTDRRVGQLWLDHTGHNSDRQYGSSTKAWRFDAVGCMAPVGDGQNDPRSTGFTLSFDHPGKARRRTPDNWREFEAQTIRLQDDRWTAEPVAIGKESQKAKEGRLKPATEAQYKALHDALVKAGTQGQATKEEWYAECVRLALAQPVPAKAGWKDRARIEGAFRARMSELKVAGWIGVDGDLVTDIRRGR